jgi:membrane protein
MKHITLGVLYFQASRIWSTVKFYVRNIGKNFFKQEVPFLSSAIAFNILLCFIPLILVLLSIIGTMLLSYDVTIRDVGQFLDSVIPPQPYRSTMKAVVVQIVGDLMANRSSIGMVGVVLLLYTSTSLFSALRSALHKAVGEPAPMDLLHSQVKDIIIVFALGLLFVAVGVAVQAYPMTRFIASASVRSPIPVLPIFLAKFGLFAFSIFTMYFLYRFIPSYSTTHTGSFIASMTATVLWEVSNRIFTWYLSQYQPFTKVYGPYAFMLAAMVWMYTISIIFLVGGMAGHIHGERKKGVYKNNKGKPETPAPKTSKEMHRP